MSTLESLTNDQRDQLYDMLLDLPTKEVVEKISQPAPEGFGIKTHITTLRRFKDRRWAELAADREDCARRFAPTTPENSDTLEVGIQIAIKHHMFERVSASNITDEQLSLVSRWAHRQEKLKLDIQRVQIARERCAQNQLRLELFARTRHTSLGAGRSTPHSAVQAGRSQSLPSPSRDHNSQGERLSPGNKFVAGLGNQQGQGEEFTTPPTSYPPAGQHTQIYSAQDAPAATDSEFLVPDSEFSRPLPNGHYINEDGRECDELGPIARNGEEVSERCRRMLGVPKEEWDRRRSRSREIYEEKYGQRSPDISNGENQREENAKEDFNPHLNSDLSSKPAAHLRPLSPSRNSSNSLPLKLSTRNSGPTFSV